MAFLTLLDRSGWSVTASSTWDASFVATRMLDGNDSTDWHSGSAAVYPHSIVLDLGSAKVFDTFRFKPRSDTRNPATSEVYVSDDGVTWGSAVGTASGWDSSVAAKDITFASSVTKRYVKFVGLTAAAGAGNYMGSAEVYLGLTFTPVYRISAPGVPAGKDARVGPHNHFVHPPIAPCDGGGGGGGGSSNYGYTA